MALLIQNQAAFVARLSETDRQHAEYERQRLELERRHLEFERATAERFTRIEAQMSEIIRVLNEHGRILQEHGQMMERLTEAVVKEIELRTPYKVVSSANADSVLHVRLIAESKRVIAENINDEPRDIEVELGVGVSWIGRQGEPLIQRTAIPAPWLGTTIGQAANFVPEAGQSIALAQQEAIIKLAEQIVDQMEAPPY